MFPARRSRKLRDGEIKEGALDSDNVSAATLVETAVKAAFLLKRSEQGLFHNWKRRWVVLTVVPRSTLYYFEDEGSLAPQGVIHLDGASVTSLTQPKFKSADGPVVRVRTKAGRVFYFQSGVAALETLSWLAALAASPGVAVVAEDQGGEEDKGASTSSSIGAPAPSTDGSGAPLPTGPTAEAPSDAVASPLQLLPPAAGAQVNNAPRAGPRALDPVAELGVSDGVVAAIADLNSEVQTAWEAVLAAALRARGLEQMQHVERELAQSQARADAAQIATLTAEAAALHRELDDLRGGVGLPGEGELMHELRRALRAVEVLRRDVDLAASACEASRDREAALERDVEARTEAALLAELRPRLGLPSESASSGYSREAVLRSVADAVAARDATADALRTALRDVCAASGLPVPAAVVGLLGEEHSASQRTAASALPRPTSTALRPPPNKPPRSVLQSQVDLASRAPAGGDGDGSLPQSATSAPETLPAASAHPALLVLHRACEDALVKLEVLEIQCTDSSKRSTLSGGFSHVRETLAASVTQADAALSCERNSAARELERARGEAEALLVKISDLQRSNLEQRRATELATCRSTQLELQALDRAAEAELLSRTRALAPVPGTPAASEVASERLALAEALTELAALRDSNASLQSDCDAAKVLAALAREESVRLARAVQQAQDAGERASSDAASISRDLANARALIRSLQLQLASRPGS